MANHPKLPEADCIKGALRRSKMSKSADDLLTFLGIEKAFLCSSWELSGGISCLPNVSCFFDKQKK
jgi:hypothetical protein